MKKGKQGETWSETWGETGRGNREGNREDTGRETGGETGRGKWEGKGRRDREEEQGRKREGQLWNRADAGGAEQTIVVTGCEHREGCES